MPSVDAKTPLLKPVPKFALNAESMFSSLQTKIGLHPQVSYFVLKKLGRVGLLGEGVTGEKVSMYSEIC